MPVSVQEFASKIKQKYPQYSNIDDNTLTQKMLDKYPQYRSQVNFGASMQTQQLKPQPQSSPTDLFGKIKEGAMQGFMKAGEAISPLTRSLTADQSDFSKGVRNFQNSAVTTAVNSLGNQAKYAASALEDQYNPYARNMKMAGKKDLGTSPLSYLAEKGQEALQDFTGGVRQKSMQENDATEGSLSTLTGDLTGTIAGSLPAMYAGGGISNGLGLTSQALKNAPWLQKAGAFGLNSLINTEAGAIAGKGENANGKDMAYGLGIDTLLKIPGLTNLYSKIAPKLSGMSDETINTLRNSELGQEVLNKLNLAKSAKINPLENLNPLQDVGENILKPSVSRVKNLNSGLGLKLDKTLENSQVKLSTNSALQSFESKLKDSGLVIRNGTVSPTATSRITSKKDLTILKETYKDLIKFSRKEELKPSKFFNLIGRLDDRINYNNNKSLEPITTQTQNILKNARATMSENLKTAIPKSKKIFSQMSGNHDILDFFNKKLGENASSASVLKNAFSPLRKDELLPYLRKLEGVTGKKIINPMQSAKTAMEIAGDSRGLNLLEGVIQGKDIKSGLLDSLRKAIFNPEKVAKSIVKSSSNQGRKEILNNDLLKLILKEYINK